MLVRCLRRALRGSGVSGASTRRESLSSPSRHGIAANAKPRSAAPIVDRERAFALRGRAPTRFKNVAMLIHNGTSRSPFEFVRHPADESRETVVGEILTRRARRKRALRSICLSAIPLVPAGKHGDANHAIDPDADR